jgi:hypothetical protein
MRWSPTSAFMPDQNISKVCQQRRSWSSKNRSMPTSSAALETV